MTEQPVSPVLYRRTDHPGSIPAVPPGDITATQFERMRPDLRREVRHSPLYTLVAGQEAPVTPVAPVITKDPLGGLDDDAYEALSPAEKGQRTKEAKRLADEAATANQEAAGGQKDGE